MSRIALLGLAAALAVAAWPPVGVGALGFLMLAPLVAALEGLGPRRAAAAVWIQQTFTALFVTRFLHHALTQEYAVAPAAAVAFALAVIGVLALGPAAVAALYAALRPRVGPAAAPLLFAALWTLGEWLRAAPLGVPWLLLGHVVARTPLWLQGADLGGVWAPGFLLAATGAGVGLAARQRRALPLLAPAVLLLLAAGYGGLRLVQPAPPGEALRVAVVQAAVPQAERFQPGSALRNTRRHAELTRKVVAAGAPALVIWSETAVDDDLDRQPALRAELSALAREIGMPIVTGAPRSRLGAPENAVVLFTPEGGLVESYAKQRLLPIAERDVPWARPLLPLVREVAAGTPYVAGGEATVFEGAGARFAAPICFEITYPDLMRGFRAAGAEWFVNLSNDAWFGPVGYPELHLRHTLLRAVELRRWIARGANTGISAVVDPTGRVVAELPAFSEGTLVAEIRARRGETLYARFGDLPVLSVLVAVAGASVLLRRGPRRPA